MAMMSIVTGHPKIDGMTPEGLKTALFSLGCFLNAEARFGLVRGVWRTAVGYAGGRSPSPDYSDIGDHTEAVWVEYDPQTVSYGQLLELVLFWQSTSPCPHSRHASCVFVGNEAERRLAQAAVDRSCLYCDHRARILPLKAFYRAEAWCQKYHLRAAEGLFQGLLDFYGTEEELLRSTAAARLNGFLGQSNVCMPESPELYGLCPDALTVLQDLCPPAPLSCDHNECFG